MIEYYTLSPEAIYFLPLHCMAKQNRSVLIKDRKGEFRWETYAGNNKTIGASTEGFHNRADAIENAKMNGVKKILDKTK